MSQRTLRGTALKKVKTSGFRNRMGSKTGRQVINSRRRKKRTKLTVYFNKY
jgi:large subunit ribosomal protein L34